MLNIQSVPVGEIMTNCYVITDNATNTAAVIDPGAFSPDLGELLESVGYNNIEYILLTHGHYDHIGGVNAVLKKCDAKVAVYKDDAPFLSDNYLNLSYRHFDKGLEPTPYDIQLHDGDIIRIGESKLRVLHTPGHTGGSVSFVCAEDRVVFCGDTLFLGSCGRTDFPTSSSEQMMKSLRRLKNLAGNYRMLCGHGLETTLDYERHNNPFMSSYEDLY